MTVDKFTRLFKQCPVCKSKITFDNNDLPCFSCENNQYCFIGFPGREDIKHIDMIYLYLGNFIYQYTTGRLSVISKVDDEDWTQDKLEMAIDMDEETMVGLFQKPQNIEKYLLLA